MSMAAAPEAQDEEIIKELVALQEVPVMGKLQSLLRSVCNRLALQGSKIEKAEEQGRIAALLKDEFEHLSKSALEDLRAEKEADQNDWLKLIDDKLKGFENIAKQYGEAVAALQGVDISILQSLPNRLSALEEKIPGLQETENGGNPFDMNNKTKPFDEDDSSNGPTHQLPNLSMDERMDALQADLDDQNDKISRLEDQIKELKGTMQDAAKVYTSDIESLQKICRNLRSDIEMLPILDMSPPQESEPSSVPVNPDYTIALSEIQNRLQRKADNDTVNHLLCSTAQAKEGLEKLKLIVDELKHQMRSAAPPPSRRASSTIVQATLAGANMTELAPQKEMEIDPKIISEIIAEKKVVKSADGELFDNRLKLLENELFTLATQLAGKADRKDLNGLQIQMTLLEEQHPNNLSSSLAPFNPDGVLMETSPSQDIQEMKQEQNNLNVQKDIEMSDHPKQKRNNHAEPQQVSQQEEPIPDTISSSEFQKLKSTYVALQISIQKLQELISQKADRDELLQLHQSVYRQKSECPTPQLTPQLPPMLPSQLAPSGGGVFENEHYQQMYKSLMLEMENMNNKMKKLEERSDLNVLITKRLENFTQPAATVQETSQGLNEVKAAINEHADRMMEYADTLLQMEALLATKADAAGLQVLRQSILELKKRSKEHSLELHASSMQSSPQLKQQGEKALQYITAAEKVEKHEMMLSKLLKDMELLGTGILTLSGHNHGDVKESDMQQTNPGAEEILETKDPHLENSAVAGLHTKKHETHSIAADVKVDSTLKDNAHAQDNKEHEGKIGDKTMDQTVAQTEASAKAADHHDTFLELEEALHENLIKPKGDAEIVNKLAEDLLPLSVKMNEFNETLRALQDNTAEKDELQKMKTYLKQRLDRAETAMFSGKGLPGFKCMSCAHRLEKLNPNRAEFVPTNSMRRQVLPMLAAERLYHRDGEIESPRAPGTTSPTYENQNKSLPTNSMQLLSPGPLELQEGQSPPSNAKPRAAKKK